MIRLLLTAVLIGANAFAQTAALEGRIHDPSQHPVAGASVSLKSASGSPAATTLADNDGRFHFTGLPEGPYTITASKSGYLDASASVVLKAQDKAALDLAIYPDKEPDFFDEPTFTVAGVTDPGPGGGHGSDTLLRSTETLAKATAGLRVNEHDAGTADDLRALGEVEERSGHPLEAAHAFERAAQLAATEPNLFAWGADLLKHRAAAPAKDVFTKANRLFPNSVRMLLGLGASWYALGAFDKAAQSFFQAADLSPADADPYLFLGRVQDMNSTDQQGITERLARFARLQPENALANYYFAQSLWRQKQDAKTAAVVRPLLEKAVRLDPTLSSAFLQLGIVLDAANDLSGAIAAYREAIKGAPDLPQAHYRLGQTYKRAGQPDQARREFALYTESAKKAAEQAERERAAIPEFVFDLRSGSSVRAGSPGAH